VLATGCGGGPPAAVAPTVTVDPASLYEGFPACEPPPDPIDFEPVEGMVLPEGTVVLEIDEFGPLISVTGLVESTPLEIRDEFAQEPEVEVIHLEDEGYEAEILVDDLGRRTYIKASIRCRTGSVVAAVIADAAAASGLPVPGGQGGS